MKTVFVCAGTFNVTSWSRVMNELSKLMILVNPQETSINVESPSLISPTFPYEVAVEYS